MIEVEDTGVGISSEMQEQIFDRFQQGNHKRSGHGLGLHLCYQIVQFHQGTIEVNSRENQGSLFRVYLPTSIESELN